MRERVTRGEQRRQESQPDEKADPTTTDQFAQFARDEPLLAGEVPMNRLFEDVRLVRLEPLGWSRCTTMAVAAR